MSGPLLITHAEVVLEDEVLPNATLLVEDGMIRRILPAESAPADLPALDAGGAYLIPGLIDTHNDGLENEINPRPLVGFPPEFALVNYERRSVAAGVTTSFHAISFLEQPRSNRTVEGGIVKSDAVHALAGRGAVDHQLLHRCDVWTPQSLDPIFASMGRARVRAMALQDHTPGQGQMRNIDGWRTRMEASKSKYPNFDAERELRLKEERAQDTTTIPYVLGRAREEQQRAPYVMLSHDDDTAEKVDKMVALGATIAEFPVTLEAARRARERGQWITVGAPNIVRGGSVSGNQSAEELAAEGLADIICADYHAPSMLYAACRLVTQGLRDLPAAIATLTANPARAFGLADRGRIAEGLRADVALVRIEDGRPKVSTVLRGGAVVFTTAEVEERTPVMAG